MILLLKPYFLHFLFGFGIYFPAVENFGYIHSCRHLLPSVYLTQLYSNCPGRWIGRNIEKKGVRSYINRIRLKEFHNGSKIILKTYLQFQMKWQQITKVIIQYKNFYVLKLHLNLFEISNQFLKFN